MHLAGYFNCFHYKHFFQCSLLFIVRPNLTITPLLVRQTEGGTFTLTCSATPSRPRPAFSWFLNSQQLTSDNQLTILDPDFVQTPAGLYEGASQLVAPRTLRSLSGNYTCATAQLVDELIITSVAERPALVLINGW